MGGVEEEEGVFERGLGGDVEMEGGLLSFFCFGFSCFFSFWSSLERSRRGGGRFSLFCLCYLFYRERIRKLKKYN